MSSHRAKRLTWRILDVSPKTKWAFVCLTLENEVVGWGEATMFGEEPAIAALLTALAERVSDGRPAIPGPIMELVATRHVSSALVAVRSALEQAALDALAKSAQLPLAHMLGGPFHQTVPVYANINRGISDRTPNGFGERAGAIVAGGANAAVKIAPFDGLQPSLAGSEYRRLFEAGLERIAAVRDAIGPDVRLLIDCHARFDIVGAHRLLDGLRPFEIFWIEEPVSERALDAQAVRRLRTRANARGIRLAGAEDVQTLKEMSDILARGIYDCVLPDLRFTGIQNGLAMLRLAASHGVGVSIHNPAGPVLDAVSQSVAEALPDFLILEQQVGESSLFDALTGNSGGAVRGGVAANTSPGHGCTPDAAVIAAAEGWDGAAALGFAGMAGAGPDA